MFQLSQLAAANYHYKRYSLDYFLQSVEKLGYESIELWASGPHLHLEDFDTAALSALKRKIANHHLTLACFTPEQCLYPISVCHPDATYRNRSVDFFCRHLQACTALGCETMVVSTGIAYLDIPAEESWGWCVDAMGRIARMAEAEGVWLATEPFTKFTTHICNSAVQLRRLIDEVGSPRLQALADTDVIATTGVDSFAQFVDTLGDRLRHVHFLDGAPGGHLVPGDGSLDLENVLSVLAQADYKGYFGLEVLDRRYVLEPEEAMRNAMTWYRRYAL